MMFENQTKGWHGCYSNAGRSSAEKFHMIINKDKIIYGQGKRIKIKELSKEEEEEFEQDPVNDILTPQVDIFDNTQELLMKKRKAKLEAIKKKKKKKTFAEKLKPLYTSNTPNCTKYNPKLTCILKRSLSGPNWDKIQGRIKSLNEVHLNDLQFFVTNDAKKTGHNFVEMKYQTQRGPFRSSNDVRYRTDILYEFPKLNKVNNSNSKQSLSNDNNNNTITKERSFNFSHNDLFNAKWSQSPTSKDSQRKNTQFSGFMNQTPSKILFNTTKFKNRLIKGPDFKKTISRAYINFLHREKHTSASYNIPNTVLNSKRSSSMVLYEKSLRTPNKNKELRTMRIDPSLTAYQLKEPWKKSTSYVSAPNFNLMSSRPNDQSPLPFYMQQICDRNSYYMISSKTLKMNNYANGTLRSGYDSFFPKKSFNKIINMKLLSSDKVIDRVIKSERVVRSRLDVSMSKVINYYRKNLDDNTTHESYKRFDSITLKSIPRNTLTSPIDKQKFDVDFY